MHSLLPPRKCRNSVLDDKDIFDERLTSTDLAALTTAKVTPSKPYSEEPIFVAVVIRLSPDKRMNHSTRVRAVYKIQQLNRGESRSRGRALLSKCGTISPQDAEQIISQNIELNNNQFTNESLFHHFGANDIMLLSIAFAQSSSPVR